MFVQSVRKDFIEIENKLNLFCSLLCASDMLLLLLLYVVVCWRFCNKSKQTKTDLHWKSEMQKIINSFIEAKQCRRQKSQSQIVIVAAAAAAGARVSGEQLNNEK